MNTNSIILYSTGCPVCKMLKAALDDAKVQYLTVTDVDAMQKLGISSVPVLQVDGRLLMAHEAMKWIEGVRQI